MVGVDRLQALPTALGAAAASQVPVGTTLLHWVHWPQAPAAFAIAVTISYISLLLGFHHRGRPFGSAKAITRSVMLIALTALIAAVLSVVVPHLPLSLGVFIPALLCGAVLRENEAIEELRLANPELAAVVTIGISYLLGRVREQTQNDRGDWCDRQVDRFRRRYPHGGENKRASLESFSELADDLYRGMVLRLPEGHGDRTKAEDRHAVVKEAVAAAPRGRYQRGLFGEKYHEAEQALKLLLQVGYDWKYDNIIDRAAAANQPRQLRVTPAGASQHRRRSFMPH